MTATDSTHIATVRQFDPDTGNATIVVPGLYGDTPIEARPFLPSSGGSALPVLNPGDTVAAFYDGGNPMTILRWYLTGGSSGGGTGGGITTEDAVDAVAAALRAGTGISIVYNDAANTVTITNSAATGLDTEAVIDAVAAALQAGTGISIIYNDPAGTITLTSTSTGTDEVWVGPDTPPAAQEVWYDTDAVSPVTYLLTGVVKSTAPTAADFGGTIPVGAVWVQS